MLDIGWSELILIGIVALIVVGPKDLPRMFHALGRMTGKARNMAREFQRAMDDAAKSTGLDEVRRDLNDIRDSTSPRKLGIDALESAASKFEKWDPKSVLKPAAPAATAAATPALAAAPTATTAAPVVTAAPPATVDLGPATAALAEKKAADQAAARQKALELQAARTEAASRQFTAKATDAPAEETPAIDPAAEVASVAPEETPAPAPKPARKPPVRKKKSDA